MNERFIYVRSGYNKKARVKKGFNEKDKNIKRIVAYF